MPRVLRDLIQAETEKTERKIDELLQAETIDEEKFIWLRGKKHGLEIALLYGNAIAELEDVYE